MADAAHLVGGQAEILPGVFLRDVGDPKSLVEVLQLGLACGELTSFLVPHDVWCWSKEREGDKRTCKTRKTFLRKQEVILHVEPLEPRDEDC